MNKVKKQMANGCNIAAVVLLNTAMFSLAFSYKVDLALPIAGIAAIAAFIGTMLHFQNVFEKWGVPNVSFSTKQVGFRGKRHERNP